MVNSTIAMPDAADLARRVREQIRSKSSLRVFDLLVNCSGGIDTETVSLKTGVSAVGPAAHGIRLAARRAGVDPKTAYNSSEVQGKRVMKTNLVTARPSSAKAKRAKKSPKQDEPSCDRLTSLEAAVMSRLSDTPRPLDVLAAKSGLTRSEARVAMDGLVKKNLAAPRAGAGYALSTSTARGGRRRGDVVEDRFAVLVGDAEERLGVLPDGCVDAYVMSSPYYKERDYGVAGQIGWEDTPDAFVARVLRVLGECSRTLAPHGLIFFNFDDHVAKGRQSCLDAKILTKLSSVGLEKFREIIWHKEAPIPNGTDNAPSHSYEKIFVLKKIGQKHYWDTFKARKDAKTGGMKRLDDVWTIQQSSLRHHGSGRHYATFPPELVERCLDVSTSEKGYCSVCGAPWERVLERGASTWKQHGIKASDVKAAAKKKGKADTNVAVDANGKRRFMKMADMKHVGWRPTCSHRAKPKKALVCDPFVGSGTTGRVAVRRGCDFFGVDLNPESVKLAAKAIRLDLRKLSVKTEKSKKKPARRGR